MPRNPRCVAPGVVYHVTQRGVNRGDVFFSHGDRNTYLHLMEGNLADAGARVLAWCLMTNHVHWVVAPEREDSLAVLFRRVHGRYAQYLNARRGRSGHLWQNRFFCCPVAAAREEIALRYVELNPVRAGLTLAADGYAWSSAGAHLRGPEAEGVKLLDWDYWRSRGGSAGWSQMLGCAEEVCQVQELRRATYAGAPLGPREFIEEWENRFSRQWRKVGRPRKQMGAERPVPISGIRKCASSG